ncbi:DUF1403 family protein [Mesorhizobium sp.]|uniref:DUF1403 family protein n=1 Tax=Mesorhizobium sp. TaxID=1871066 RepID=UPI003424EC9A
MIRLDPATASPTAPPTVPAWALAAGGSLHDADAAFQAGAALASLDTLARVRPTWAGAWRQRLALKCAVTSMRLAGRAEDEAALRDAWQLCPADARSRSRRRCLWCVVATLRAAASRQRRTSGEGSGAARTRLGR